MSSHLALPCNNCILVRGLFLFECVVLCVFARKRVRVADETAANNGGGNLALYLLLSACIMRGRLLTLQQVRADINSVHALP